MQWGVKCRLAPAKKEFAKTKDSLKLNIKLSVRKSCLEGFEMQLCMAAKNGP